MRRASIVINLVLALAVIMGVVPVTASETETTTPDSIIFEAEDLVSGVVVGGHVNNGLVEENGVKYISLSGAATDTTYTGKQYFKHRASLGSDDCDQFGCCDRRKGNSCNRLYR